jgi:hypothetical protein
MLAACPDLTHVECTNILFKTSSFQAVFARKAVMDTVILRNCTIPLDESETYRVKNVQVTGPAGLSGFAAENHRYAVASLLIPEHLVRLCLDMPDLLQDLLPLLISKGDFTSLKAADLSVPSGAAWPELGAFSKKCPGLSQLTLTQVVTYQASSEAESSDLVCPSGRCAEEVGMTRLYGS